MDEFICIFFSSLTALDHYTHALDSSLPASEACTCCGKNDQWVSHGYTYKYLPHNCSKISGKRILCSNRYGKAGCGHTRQLYLQEVIPRRQYHLPMVIAFIKALFVGTSIENAYMQATGSIKETRQAWRWLKDFFKRLSKWRTLISQSSECFVVSQRSRRLQILLPTLQQIFDSLCIDAIQHQLQQAFF